MVLLLRRPAAFDPADPDIDPFGRAELCGGTQHVADSRLPAQERLSTLPIGRIAIDGCATCDYVVTMDASFCERASLSTRPPPDRVSGPGGGISFKHARTASAAT